MRPFQQSLRVNVRSNLRPRIILPARLYRMSSSISAEGRITLNETEQKFCDLLKEFAQTHDPPVECRIAGGWVRDKLLSLPSHDLDIALPLSSGYTFAAAFVDFLKLKDVTVGSVGRVAANPEQSKHLETGTTRIMGLECDFVGLRSETYADSRIPNEVKLGTPLEDALRRDLTMNALFYNVSNGSIEDLTEKGLSDLENKIARTPLPPRQTFLDDPLRVLRTVRFASRFDLKIENEVASAAKDEDIQAALSTKVSKERVGIEVMKTLTKAPLTGLSLIHDLNLHSSIFTCPGLPESELPTKDFYTTVLVLRELLERWEELFDGPEYLWLAAALSPYAGLIVKGKKEVPAVSVAVAEGLKLSSDATKAVSSLFVAETLLDPHTTRRSDIGVVLQCATVRPWRRSIIWTIARSLQPQYEKAGKWDEEADTELSKWKKYVEKIRELGLESDIDKPPMVSGKELQTVLGVKPSPLFQVILKAINVWQLDHPGATVKECESWLKEMWEGEGRREWEDAVPPPAVKEKRKR